MTKTIIDDHQLSRPLEHTILCVCHEQPAPAFAWDIDINANSGIPGDVIISWVILASIFPSQ